MFPRFVPPQLATLVDEVPVDPSWIFETKYDGYRIESVLRSGKAKLISRSAKDWTRKFAPIATAVEGLPVRSAVLDGELVAVDENERTAFRILQRYFDRPDPSRLRYFVFDLLQLNGVDTRSLPLTERRKLLRALIARVPKSSPIRMSRALGGRGKGVLDGACRLGLEGVIGKLRSSTYESGRSNSWIKIKCGKRQEFVIVGFTLPGGSRQGFGALVLAHMEHDHLRFAGRVGTGFSDVLLRRLRSRLDPLRIQTPPVEHVPPAMALGVQWVRPVLIAEVAFADWTEYGLLRHASFQGLREDKASREVVREGLRLI